MTYYILSSDHQAKKEFLFNLIRKTKFNQVIENPAESDKFRLTLSLSAQELEILVFLLQSSSNFNKYFSEVINES